MKSLIALLIIATSTAASAGPSQDARLNEYYEQILKQVKYIRRVANKTENPKKVKNKIEIVKRRAWSQYRDSLLICKNFGALEDSEKDKNLVLQNVEVMREVVGKGSHRNRMKASLRTIESKSRAMYSLAVKKEAGCDPWQKYRLIIKGVAH